MSAYLEQAVLGAGQEQAFFIAGEMVMRAVKNPLEEA